MPEPSVYSVGSLVAELRSLLEAGYRSIWVEGEVSSLSAPASGHLYFSLKEGQALIRCAFFRNRRQGATIPKDGMQVLARGQISVYPSRGDLQLIVHHLELSGEGALRRQFELLKQKLKAEGLFDAKKKPLPVYPQTIGIVTSESGAAWRDILVTLQRRFPPARLILYPVTVQGDAAPAEIVAMLDQASATPNLDVLILARGGGSLEDLQAFNEERVARAIHRCPIPLVSGVGHETDFTIADLVADHRAATPTAAAEMVTPLASMIRQQVAQQSARLMAIMARHLGDLGQQVDHLTARLVHPSERLRRHRLELETLHQRSLHHTHLTLASLRQQVNHQRNLVQRHNPVNRLRLLQERYQTLNQHLHQATNHHLADIQYRLNTLAQALDLLGPNQTLTRGYAILRNSQTHVVSSVSRVQPGEQLSALLSDGSLSLKVHEK